MFLQMDREGQTNLKTFAWTEWLSSLQDEPYISLNTSKQDEFQPSEGLTRYIRPYNSLTYHGKAIRLEEHVLWVRSQSEASPKSNMAPNLGCRGWESHPIWEAKAKEVGKTVWSSCEYGQLYPGRQVYSLLLEDLSPGRAIVFRAGTERNLFLWKMDE